VGVNSSCTFRSRLLDLMWLTMLCRVSMAASRASIVFYVDPWVKHPSPGSRLIRMDDAIIVFGLRMMCRGCCTLDGRLLIGDSMWVNAGVATRSSCLLVYRISLPLMLK